MSSNDTQAAIFDIDGLLFGMGIFWRVVHPGVGSVGSTIGWKEGERRFFDILKKKPEATFQEYFLLDETSFVEHRKAPVTNVTPVQVLIRTAVGHALRDRTILLLSSRPFPGLGQLLSPYFESEKHPPLWENPFEKTKTLCPAISIEPGSEIPVKMALLQSILVCESDGNTGLNGRLFSKIFFYYTQPDYIPYLNAFVTEKHPFLEDRKNALIYSMIVSSDESEEESNRSRRNHWTDATQPLG